MSPSKLFGPIPFWCPREGGAPFPSGSILRRRVMGTRLRGCTQLFFAANDATCAAMSEEPAPAPAVTSRHVAKGLGTTVLARLGAVVEIVAQPLYVAMFGLAGYGPYRSEEHTSELPSLMRSSYAVFRLKKKTTDEKTNH